MLHQERRLYATQSCTHSEAFSTRKDRAMSDQFTSVIIDSGHAQFNSRYTFICLKSMETHFKPRTSWAKKGLQKCAIAHNAKQTIQYIVCPICTCAVERNTLTFID